MSCKQRGRSLTEHRQGFVQHVVQRPDVRRPVGVTETALKGEEPGEHLRELPLKGKRASSGHGAVERPSVKNKTNKKTNTAVTSHHGDERAKGQSADRGHDGAQSQQAQQAETRPPDGAVCKINTWSVVRHRRSTHSHQQEEPWVGPHLCCPE